MDANQNGAEAADLADCFKVFHEVTNVMSLSWMKGEQNSPFSFVVQA